MGKTVLLKQKKRPVLDMDTECGKINLLYPIQASSFVSIVMYLTYTIIVEPFKKEVFLRKSSTNFLF
jgi:hypothetical protein